MEHWPKNGLINSYIRGHSFSTYTKFSKKLTFRTSWYAHTHFVNVLNEWFLVNVVRWLSICFECWNSRRKYLLIDLNNSSFFIHLFKEILFDMIYDEALPFICWKNHLTNCFFLMHRWGINTNLFLLTFCRAKFNI